MDDLYSRIMLPSLTMDKLYSQIALQSLAHQLGMFNRLLAKRIDWIGLKLDGNEPEKSYREIMIEQDEQMLELLIGLSKDQNPFGK